MKKLSIILSLCCLLTILFSASVLPSSAADGTVELIPDGSGSFYLIEYHADSFAIDMISHGRNRRTLLRENRSLDGCASNGTCLVAYGELYGQLCLNVISEQRDSSMIIEQSGILPNGITTAGDQMIYLITAGNKSEIQVYRRWNRFSHTVSLSRPASALFTDIPSGRPFALTNGGVLDADTGSFIACETPSLPFSQNDGYYTDASGRLFHFTPETGFTKIGTFPTSRLCFCGNRVYYPEGDTILCCSLDGAPVSQLIPSRTIRDISASGENLLVLYEDGSFETLSRSAFQPLEQESSSLPDPVSQDSPSASNPVSSANESPVLNLGDYRTENGLLYGIPQGTTIAVFKKSIIYTGYTLTVWDHHSRQTASGVIGTGFRFEFRSAHSVQQFTAVISGDLTGEGSQNSRDLLLLSRHLCGEVTLSDSALAAADLNQDGLIDIRDQLSLHRSLASP